LVPVGQDIPALSGQRRFTTGSGGWTTAQLAAIGDDSARSATFVVTMLTGEKPNVVGMLDTAESRQMLEKAAAAAGQVVPGTALRTLFTMLRPNDLVCNYLVGGWFMGKSPRPVRRPGMERRRYPDHGQVRVCVRLVVAAPACTSSGCVVMGRYESAGS
jgi:hypothetical protein